MTLDKTQLMNHYIDFYGALLTKKQLEIIEYYYQDNYSYAEISEILNTTRSAVYDMIKRVEKILLDYEEKMKLVHQYQMRLVHYRKLQSLNIKEVNDIVIECLNTE